MTNASRRDLVGQGTREAIRDTMSSTVLREIDQMWQDELFPPPTEDIEPVGGQRVTHFQAYLNQVDWTDPGHVARARHVFEVALRPWFSPPEGYTCGVEVVIPRVQKLHGRDGYVLDEHGRITGRASVVIADDFLTNITDPIVVHEYLERISAAMERADPAQAIGSAKELVESTAKLVLREREQVYGDGEDLPALVKKAQEALAVHPAGRAPGLDGAYAVRKILGAVSTVTNGVAELRNRGYGAGHGRPRSGLRARHARLAINAPRLWYEFMLDTLSDPEAPWRSIAYEAAS